MSERTLGRRPANPERMAAAVDATPFLLAAAERLEIPTHPPTQIPPSIRYPMLNNDAMGDCVLVSSQHNRLTVDHRWGVPWPGYSDDLLVADYRTQNPGFVSIAQSGGGSDDNGMVMQEFFDYLVAQKRLVAFGRVDHTNEDALKAAIYVLGAVSTGEVLDQAQDKQTDAGYWDVVAGSPEWGGHATAANGYDPDTISLATWGRQIRASDALVARQFEEAWVLLWPEQVMSPPPGFDMAGFAAEVRAVTDGKVDPLKYVPPEPTPPPAPGPGPDPMADFPFTTVNRWANKPHWFHAASEAARDYKAWKKRHGYA